jgi:hypothetical protein
MLLVNWRFIQVPRKSESVFMPTSLQAAAADFLPPRSANAAANAATVLKAWIHRMTAQSWQVPICLSVLLVSTIVAAGEAVVPVETPVASLAPVFQPPSPPAVRRTIDAAAARLLWNDPAIRNFIGLSENAQDFTDPDAIPGFGRLGPADQPHAR